MPRRSFAQRRHVVERTSERAVVAGLFGANALFHLLWSPLFFTLRRPDWALAEVVFLWLSLVALITWLWPYEPLAAWLLAPYILWVTFASWLNLEIVRLNGPFGPGHLPHERGSPPRNQHQGLSPTLTRWRAE